MTVLFGIAAGFIIAVGALFVAAGKVVDAAKKAISDPAASDELKRIEDQF